MLKLFTPYFFQRNVPKSLPYIFLLCLCFLGYGLYESLFVSPPDYQQGETVRIMYVHVPAAWMSLGVYFFIALCSIVNLIWNIRFCYVLAVAASLPGAAFALITLITGSLWGKTMWGAWWVWDARLSSMFVLFMLYISYIITVNSSRNLYRAEKPASVIGILGFINVPIVKFSVNIWYSLHQPASVLRVGGPTIHASMLAPLLIMFAAFILYFIALLIIRVQIILKGFKDNRNLACCYLSKAGY
jgi:heme exporter protein C